MTDETTEAPAPTTPPAPRPRPRKPGVLDRIKQAASLTLRAGEFGYYHVLLSAVDRVARLPRNTTVPEAMRLYRENIALKAQLDALEGAPSDRRLREELLHLKQRGLVEQSGHGRGSSWSRKRGGE